MKNIVIIGMPGSGKTTIGREISKKLKKDFFDTDKEIEKRYKESISSIFKRGEGGFRRIESEIIREVSSLEDKVISTGGGVVKNKKNIDFLKEKGIIVFLDRSILDIARNIDISNRPLINDVFRDIQNIYTQRIHLYRQFCDISVDNIGDIEKVCGKIIEKVKNF